MKIGIVKEINNFHDDYIKACQDLGVEYEVIDITSKDWIRNIKEFNGAGLVVRPSCGKADWKQMYDEKLYFINENLNIPMYPSYGELFIYENKRTMAYWLEMNNIPSPETFVFYDRGEAIKFVNGYNSFPLMFKPNTGSAALGVKVIKNSKEAKVLINKIFTRFKFFNRGYTKWKKSKFKLPYPIMDDRQYNNILFQEKIDVKYEWRGVKIGESYFAHKKLSDKNGLHSGSGEANYDDPSLEVMEFLKYVCDVGSFRSMNVDFFEDYNGNFFVNELQTIFGSKIQPYQMCVGGVPGRYKYTSGEWNFEEGLFNQNNSWNLRLEDFREQLKGETNDDFSCR